MVQNYMVIYGLGGCWSGYERATIVKCTPEEISNISANIVWEYRKSDGNPKLQGCSFDWAILEGKPEDNDLWTRLKCSARKEINCFLDGVVSDNMNLGIKVA